MEISRLRELQSHFETNRANTTEAQQLYRQSEELVSQFQQKFSRDKLRSMTLEDYVVGHQSKNSFCYWLERKTEPVGKLFTGGSGYGFNLYYSQEKGAYIIQEGKQGKVVTEDEAIKRLEIIKTGLIELLDFGEKKVFGEIRRVFEQLNLDQHTIGKILCLYFPDKYLGLFSNRHMNEFLSSFGLLDNRTENSDAFEKREILLAFKEKDEVMKNWANRKYTDFLYNEIKTSSSSDTPTEVYYFALRTGSGEYSDQPNVKYNFKEGIPGYKQLLEAGRKAKFVYLENGLFYGKGQIGEIKSYEKDGTKFYDAQVLDYKKMQPVPYTDISNRLSKPFSQAGIMKISEADYRLVTEFETTSALKYTIEDFVTETGFERAQIESWVRILRRKKQVIFQGPPGTGKTFVALRLAKILVSETAGLIQIVQFHPDYSYEDFIQGYFPQPKNGALEFELKRGRFLELCDRAENQGNGAPCVLVIDEINRAKLARVFGELMYLLEYRDKEIPLAAGGKPFRIPENVYIIGTMNTADRSIALVDHALRRRFSFIRLQPEYTILANYLSKNKLPAKSLVDVLKQINQAIEDANYEIGISFFMKDQERLKQLLPEIWKTEIEPYLEEYFYDQRSKVESFRWDNLIKDALKEWTI